MQRKSHPALLLFKPRRTSNHYGMNAGIKKIFKTGIRKQNDVHIRFDGVKRGVVPLDLLVLGLQEELI